MSHVFTPVSRESLIEYIINETRELEAALNQDLIASLPECRKSLRSRTNVAAMSLARLSHEFNLELHPDIYGTLVRLISNEYFYY